MKIDTEEVLAAVKSNKKVILAFVVVLAIGAAAYYLRGLVIAATVNGTPISRLSVIRLLEKRSGKNALDVLITQMLIESEAKAKGITVSGDELDQAIKDIETQIAAQGGTLQANLQQGGMTDSEFRDQITIQKKLEKLLGDKISVSDQEVEQYIKDNNITLPQGQESESKKQLGDQLQQQKLNREAPQFITDLKATTTIRYYVDYGTTN